MGLVAFAFSVTADLLAMYGAIGAVSSTQVLMFMLLAVEEIVLAARMIARGFRRAATAKTPEPAEPALVGG